LSECSAYFTMLVCKPDDIKPWSFDECNTDYVTFNLTVAGIESRTVRDAWSSVPAGPCISLFPPANGNVMNKTVMSSLFKALDNHENKSICMYTMMYTERMLESFSSFLCLALPLSCALSQARFLSLSPSLSDSFVCSCYLSLPLEP